MKLGITTCVLLLGCLFCAVASGQTDVAGEPIFDPPTLHCIGVRWFVEEAKHPDASVAVAYRRKGDVVWQKAMPLRKVETAALQKRKPAGGNQLFNMEPL